MGVGGGNKVRSYLCSPRRPEYAFLTPFGVPRRKAKRQKNVEILGNQMKKFGLENGEAPFRFELKVDGGKMKILETISPQCEKNTNFVYSHDYEGFKFFNDN